MVIPVSSPTIRTNTNYYYYYSLLVI